MLLKHTSLAGVKKAPQAPSCTKERLPSSVGSLQYSMRSAASRRGSTGGSPPIRISRFAFGPYRFRWVRACSCHMGRAVLAAEAPCPFVDHRCEVCRCATSFAACMQPKAMAPTGGCHSLACCPKYAKQHDSSVYCDRSNQYAGVFQLSCNARP